MIAAASLLWAETYGVGVINAYNLNMRSGPGQDYDSVSILGKGARVRILEQADIGDWLKISHNGLSGYIRNRPQYVRIITEGPAPQADKDRHPPDAGGDTKIAGIREKAEDLSHQIEARQEEIQTFTVKENTIINGLDEIDHTLHRTRMRIAALRPELTEIEKQVADTRAKVEALKAEIDTNEAYAAKRLVALYKLNRLGMVHLLASAESMYTFFQRKTALERILAYDENVLNTLMNNMAAMKKWRATLEKQKQEKLALEAEYKQQIEIMSQEREKKNQLLEDIRTKRSLGLAALKALKQAATVLDQTIQKAMVETPKPTEVRGQYRPPSLDKLKGLLNMPVKGKVITAFGPYKNKRFDVMNFRSGIDIKAERGEPIQSVGAGVVVFAGWFKGYGNMMIIDHGHNYHTVYAHAEELFKNKGDTVANGEVIATVGDTGSMIGPGLYFEVRHHGKALNPVQWIKTG